MKFIPNDKFDLDSCEILQKSSYAEVRPKIRELLTWVQDVNWPVALPIMNVLGKYGIDLIEPISEVLNSKDEIWKYNVIVHLLPLLEISIIKKLEPEILRIALTPTETEIAEEVNEKANDIIKMLAENA